MRYIQEKRADYIPRLGRRSGSSQEKEDKVEFYTPRLGRSYTGNLSVNCCSISAKNLQNFIFTEKL